MWAVALMYLGIDLVFTLVSLADGVAHYAHLGGAFAGVLLALLMCVPRDTSQASEAKAILSETKDLSTLSRLELEAMHDTNPDDTTITINWVYRSLREVNGLKPKCINEFSRQLPRILVEQEPGAVANCLTMLNLPPPSLPLRYLVELANKLERTGDFQMAARMHQMILARLDAKPEDQESSLFRLGMLSESAFRDFPRAQAYYQDLLRRSPMGPFAEPVKARLQYLSKQTTSSV